LLKEVRVRAEKIVPFAMAAAAAACSAAGSRSPPPGAASTSSTSASGTSTSTSSGSATGTGGAGGGAGLGGFDAGTGAGAPTCTAAAELAYVLSSDDILYSFAPDTKVFTMVATPNCDPTMSTRPNSMAVDRNAVAWLNYVSTDDSVGVIYTYDLTKNNGCQKTPVTLIPGWTRLGMGFSTDMVNGTTETLYVAATGAGSLGLGKIDMSLNKVLWVGEFTGTNNDLQGQSAELTGTGDAKLFGFFALPNTGKPVAVAQIVKTDGSTPAATETTLAQVASPNDWAFSFWGGSFYLYTAPGSNVTGRTSVVKYTPGGATDTGYIPDVGFIIVGAGVSTCAPLTPK
jgi:hypothetical protein